MHLSVSDVYNGRGWKCLGGEYATTFGTAKPLCTSVPQKTAFALMTVRNATLVLTFDGSTPSATVGNDYGASSTPYELVLNATELKKVKAYSAGAATVYISYFGTK